MDDCGYCEDWSQEEGCINGAVYGYCTSELCYGMCEYLGTCGCECHEEETMKNSKREPYRNGDEPGRLDINGVEWWACDPYPTWFRWENGELRLDYAKWMPDDRNIAVRYALIEVEEAEKLLAEANVRAQIAQDVWNNANEEADHG